MSYYETPGMNDTASIYDMFKYINNTATDGLFFPIMLLVIWTVSFMSLKGYGNSKAFTFASFFCAILGMLLGVLDLIAVRWMYLAMFFTLIGFVWLKLESTSKF